MIPIELIFLINLMVFVINHKVLGFIKLFLFEEEVS